MNRMIEDARKTGRAVTLYGRYRELADINSKNFQRRSFAERTAMNTPIQGTAADIMKMAMIAVYDKMKAGNSRAACCYRSTMNWWQKSRPMKGSSRKASEGNDGICRKPQSAACG